MTTAGARFMANRAAIAGAGVLAVVVLAALGAPWLAPHDPLSIDLANNFKGASWTHPLGTDHLGRDTLSRLLFGARVSLMLSAVSVASTARSVM